uniref:NADH dehydrogenase subunit 2 n=1 Tax=Pardosa pseudoannulata TaxID=330961 RepID=UPI002E761AB0|nr:NADH dehydrogenase subunit 2 [Pardosa pseudoannulata]WRI06644.1 NADH dehydrogenase subunit 2 [Pardosa pseudoannulata]
MNVVLFSFMYLISFHLVMNSDDWFLLWLGLEINMMIFIMLMYNENSMLKIESCLKYFFIQSVGSAILMSCFYLNKEWMDLVVCLLLGYKIGAGPFFFWFPSVCSGLSWMSCFVLMSFQKVIPLMIMGIFVSWIIYIMIVISLFFGIFGCFNQTNIKQLIAYSSVYHMGWIMLCNFSNDLNWFVYLVIYSLMIFPVMKFFSSIFSEDFLMLMKVKYKGWIILMVLSMAGMPPFLGFFLKLFAFMMIFNYDYYFMMFLIICSVVMFYIYFRMIYDVLMSHCMNMNWMNFMMMCDLNNYLVMMSILGLMVGIFLGIFFIM